MLRITVEEDSTSKILILEGKLTGPFVAELQQVWAHLASSADPRRLVLILTALSGIDVAGRRLLKEIYSGGASLKGCGIGINALIEDLTRNSS
jgi:hypothetical protein